MAPGFSITKGEFSTTENHMVDSPRLLQQVACLGYLQTLSRYAGKHWKPATSRALHHPPVPQTGLILQMRVDLR